MTRTRRQFSSSFVAGLGLASLFGASGALAQDDDDDDMPNVFISPPGQPFRAPMGAPYPVVDWFHQANKAGDGKLTHAEFIDDSAAFFKVLDLNGDGVLDEYEIQVYEHRVAPEILGGRVNVGALSTNGRLQLWRAQGAPAVMGTGDHEPEDHPPTGIDETKQGASPYDLFEAPEPVTAADIDFRGYVLKANFMQLAERHFTELDKGGAGFLMLGGLPKTLAQVALERTLRRRR